MKQIHNDFEQRMAAGCQSKFWVLVEGGNQKVVPANHPGAIEISCGNCLACLIVRRDRHIGRMIAAGITSVGSVFLTLTYAPKGADGVDPVGARELTPEHMIAFRKSVRDMHGKFYPKVLKSGRVKQVRRGKFQYCGAGELGELKRRVHWHVILFFDDVESVPGWAKLPQFVARDYLNAKRSGNMDADGCFISCGVRCKAQYSLKKRTDEFVAWIDEWPHGYVNIKEVGEKGPGYIAKYMMKPHRSAPLRGDKSVHNSIETYKVVSQKLGYKFIRDEGERIARAGLALSPTYQAGFSRFTRGSRAGQFRSYTMTRGMKREYFNGYMSEVARQLATGEIKSWSAPITREPADPMVARLDADAARDPRELVEKFFSKLQRGRRGPASLPYLDVGQVSRAVTTADQGVLLKTTAGEYVFTWPDLSGHGRDIRIPVRTRRELLECVRAGAVRAFGLLPVGIRTVEGEPAERSPSALAPGRSGSDGRKLGRFAWVDDRWQRVFPLVQVLEHGGAGMASEADRADAAALRERELAAWRADGYAGRRPKGGRLRWDVRRAWVTAAHVDDLRRRIVSLQVARWSPEPESLGVGVRAVGLPVAFAGRTLTAADRERWPLFSRWFLEAEPHAPPF